MKLQRYSALTLAVACCLTFATPGFAQNSAADDAMVQKLTAKANDFFESIAAGKVTPAFDELLAGSRLLSQKEQLEALVTKTQSMEKIYGAYRSFERVRAERIGTDVVVLKYLYKCDNFPVVWYVAFYRNLGPATDVGADPSGWRVVTLRFDTELQALLQ